MHDQQDANYDIDTTPQRNITGRPRRDAQVDALIAGLLQGLTVPQAAATANLARSSAYELLQLPEVQDRLRQARGEALAAAARTAAGLATEAVGVLADLMRKASSEGVRRLAADSLLAHAAALGRDQETEARIADLTAQLDAMLGGRS
jgi:hypothetical protein